MANTTEHVQPVDVRNFDMSFGRMVIFMVKWAVATIPALLTLIVVGFAAVAFLGGFVAALTSRSEPVVSAPAAFESNSVANDPAPSISTSADTTQTARPVAPKREQPSEVQVRLAHAKDLLARGQYQQAYDAANVIKGATGLDAYTIESVKNQALNLSHGNIERR